MKNKEKIKSRVGENLKIERLKKGLSQDSLAEKAGVTFHTISKIEAGATVDPRVLTLEKLVKALNIKIDDLLK
jgi:transcriptional regulator with XRE-family HTH domain